MRNKRGPWIDRCWTPQVTVDRPESSSYRPLGTNVWWAPYEPGLMVRHSFFNKSDIAYWANSFKVHKNIQIHYYLVFVLAWVHKCVDPWAQMPIRWSGCDYCHIRYSPFTFIEWLQLQQMKSLELSLTFCEMLKTQSWSSAGEQVLGLKWITESDQRSVKNRSSWDSEPSSHEEDFQQVFVSRFQWTEVSVCVNDLSQPLHGVDGNKTLFFFFFFFFAI